MANLFKAFFFKLRHDLTFKITLIIGVSLAVFLTLIYLAVDLIAFEKLGVTLNGQTMLVSSFSPTQNFGLAIPINLLTFTVMEFNQGAIRNKIIAGHSKARLYTSIFLTGLIFTFVLIAVYSLLTFGLGCAIGGLTPQVVEMGGEDAEEMASAGIGTLYDANYIWRIIIIACFSYLSIVSFCVFVATLFRSVGPSIPMVMIPIVLCSVLATMSSLFVVENDALLNVMRILDPLYALSSSEITMDGMSAYKTISDFTFISGVINNIVYAAIFFASGLIIFQRRDVK